MPGPSRRSLLLGSLGLAAAAGAAGYELVEAGLLPGKYALARLDGACGSAPPPPDGPRPGQQVESFRSAYRHREVQTVTLIPANAVSPRGLATVIALHGAGATPASLAAQIAPAMTAAAVSSCAVICVEGGDTYWHKRLDGDDPVGMIVHEVLPRAAEAGLLTGRIGVTGESMGGYGALVFAERFAVEAGATGSGAASAGPSVLAVAALSPAIFTSYSASHAASRTAFDNAADFARNSVLGRLAALRSVPAWIACGADDPFEPATSQLRARLAAMTGRQVAGGILSGCHDDAFWLRNYPSALRFISAHLDRPARTPK